MIKAFSQTGKAYSFIYYTILCIFLLMGCQSIANTNQESNSKMSENDPNLYFVPQSDFQVDIPDGWTAKYQTGPYSDDLTTLFLHSESEVFNSLAISGYKFHENQDYNDRQAFIDHWQNIQNINNPSQISFGTLSGISGFSEPSIDRVVNILAILGTEGQVAIIIGTTTLQQTDLAQDILNEILASLIIEEENPRKATLEERNFIGDSNFTLQRLTYYQITSPIGNSIQVKNNLDGLSPYLNIFWHNFDNEQAAQDWLSMEKPRDGQYTPITVNRIDGFVEEFNEGQDPLKIATFAKGDQGLTVVLFGSTSMPNENNDVFYTAIESIEWNEQSGD